MFPRNGSSPGAHYLRERRRPIKRRFAFHISEEQDAKRCPGTACWEVAYPGNEVLRAALQRKTAEAIKSST